MSEQSEVDLFYQRSRWPLGMRVSHADDPELRGMLVRRVARFWVDRDRKPPMVRWDGKIDAVHVPWESLVDAAVMPHVRERHNDDPYDPRFERDNPDPEEL